MLCIIVVFKVIWILVICVDFIKFEFRNCLICCFYIYMEFYINYVKIKLLYGCFIGYFVFMLD